MNTTGRLGAGTSQLGRIAPAEPEPLPEEDPRDADANATNREVDDA